MVQVEVLSKSEALGSNSQYSQKKKKLKLKKRIIQKRLK
jgi:hypothetical protein